MFFWKNKIKKHASHYCFISKGSNRSNCSIKLKWRIWVTPLAGNVFGHTECTEGLVRQFTPTFCFGCITRVQTIEDSRSNLMIISGAINRLINTFWNNINIYWNTIYEILLILVLLLSIKLSSSWIPFVIWPIKPI